jgi:SAM-dependent methyltransferase
MIIKTLGEKLNSSGIPLSFWSKRPDLKVFETCGCRSYPRFLEFCDYYNAFYDPKALSRKEFDIRKYADVQALPYPEEFFDMAISSDVFEHVRFDGKGFKEIFRTLKPGGIFILTIPFLGVDKKRW